MKYQLALLALVILFCTRMLKCASVGSFGEGVYVGFTILTILLMFVLSGDGK